MKILLVLCTMLIALANTSFAQPEDEGEEEPIQARQGMSGENTRMGTPAVQPGLSREKAGVIGDIGVQGRASSMQPGLSREKAGIIGDVGVKRPGSQPPPEATPITLP